MIKQNIQTPVNVISTAFNDAKTRCAEVGLVSMYLQVWDTPALGFLGVAAAQDTAAYTVVLTDLNPETRTCYVYFDGRYAYTVHNPNEQFVNDITRCALGSVLYATDYEDYGVRPQSEPEQEPTE